MTGQDPRIAAGAATYVKANVLSLFGMAWNQSAAHYLSAQGLVQPASVRFNDVLKQAAQHLCLADMPLLDLLRSPR